MKKIYFILLLLLSINSFAQNRTYQSGTLKGTWPAPLHSVSNGGYVTIEGNEVITGDKEFTGVVKTRNLSLSDMGIIYFGSRMYLKAMRPNLLTIYGGSFAPFYSLAFGNNTSSYIQINGVVALYGQLPRMEVRTAITNGAFAPLDVGEIQVYSTVHGSCPFPRMTEVQRLALPDVKDGDHVYQTNAEAGVWVFKAQTNSWVFAY